MAIGGEFSLRLLRDAGVGPGMKVLDLGCGTGDVSLLAAELVGPQGAVTGVDRDAAALEVARSRVRETGAANLTLLQGELDALPEDLGLFDVLVARRVLMYLADPAAVLAQAAALLRPGGLGVFQEHDSTMVPVSPEEFPLHRRAQGWIRETIRREGVDPHMGFNLYATLTRAGLAVEQVRAEAIVQTPRQKYPLASIVEAVLPRIVGLGVAEEAEIDIATLDRRLDQERAASQATYVGDMMFGAWARKATQLPSDGPCLLTGGLQGSTPIQAYSRGGV